MKMIVICFLATFASGAYAGDCKMSTSPFFRAASDVTIKISKDGKSEKVTLDPMLQRDNDPEFVPVTITHVDVKNIALIRLTMYFRESNVWERVDKIVPADQYKPYFIPAIRADVHMNVIQPNGFSSEAGVGDSASMPARVGIGKEVGGYRIEVAEITDRKLIEMAACGKRFEASPAEVFCFEQKYTHTCVDQYHPVDSPSK